MILAGFEDSDDPAFANCSCAGSSSARSSFLGWYGYVCHIQMILTADNEVWSFGDEGYEILKQYMFIREQLRGYIMDQMRVAHEKGIPPMRPLFVDFPDDASCYSIEDQYMFGPDLLVAPVLEAGAQSRKVYLPVNTLWKDAWTGQQYEGGQLIDVPVRIQTMPLFLKANSSLMSIFQPGAWF
jgi:alpha-D-xyloside xylohydrolase